MIPIDRPFLAGILQSLVQIDSTNPSLSGSGAGRGEAEIAAYLESLLVRLNLETRRTEPEPGRVSVVGRLPGADSAGGRSLLWNAHLDTVGVEGMVEPFSGALRDGRLYGRGAYDMKGSLAAQVAAVKALRDAGVRLRGDLFVAGVADEEFASIGVQSILADYPVDAVIVTEPSELQISLAHKGFIWIEVRVHGRAYHGSRPDLGIDANMRMGRFLGALDHLERELQARAPHPLLGPPSLHAATLHGGTEWSVYAAESILGIERRTIPGETAAQVEGEIRALIDRLQEQDDTFQADLTVKLVREPFEVSPEAPIVQTLTAVTAAVLGAPAPHIGQMFWTDAAFHAAAGIDTVLIGPRGHGPHAAVEWVDFESVVQLAQILAETARAFCGT